MAKIQHMNRWRIFFFMAHTLSGSVLTAGAGTPTDKQIIPLHHSARNHFPSFFTKFVQFRTRFAHIFLCCAPSAAICKFSVLDEKCGKTRLRNAISSVIIKSRVIINANVRLARQVGCAPAWEIWRLQYEL